MKDITPSNMSFEIYETPVYTYSLYFNGVIALIFGTTAIFLILFKSPAIFGAYKYFLFNISFWALCFDSYTTILYNPKIFFPVLAMCPAGVLASKSNTVGYITFVSDYMKD